MVDYLFVAKKMLSRIPCTLPKEEIRRNPTECSTPAPLTDESAPCQLRSQCSVPAAVRAGNRELEEDAAQFEQPIRIMDASIICCRLR
jgi:hypothetical protein